MFRDCHSDALCTVLMYLDVLRCLQWKSSTGCLLYSWSWKKAMKCSLTVVSEYLKWIFHFCAVMVSFFFLPSDLKIIIKQAKRKWIFQLFHFSLELILFYFPRTKNPKLCLKSQMADAKSQLRYILPYILGALDFMYCLFILNNTLTLSLKVEEYAYIIYTFWFCQIISHFMLSERLTTQSSQ